MDLRAGVRWAEARALLEGTGTQSALSPASLEGWAETQLHKANSRVQKRPVGPDRQTGGREGRRSAQRECVPTFLSTSRSPARGGWAPVLATDQASWEPDERDSLEPGFTS